VARCPWCPAGQSVDRFDFFVIPAEAGIQANDVYLPYWIPALAGMTEMGVIPAEAGIQANNVYLPYWIPAFAGMTKMGAISIFRGTLISLKCTNNTTFSAFSCLVRTVIINAV